MQTFLPYASFTKTARCLDQGRLINQCCNESVRLIEGKWPNHPAAKMWANNKLTFAYYNLHLAEEWRQRFKSEGKPTAAADKWFDYWSKQMTAQRELGNGNHHMPCWLGDERVHSTHRACLLAKLPSHYEQFGWKEEPTPIDPTTNKWPYYWPVQ